MGFLRSMHLHAKSFDEDRECGRLLPPTGVVKEEAGERRAPVLEHTHQCATREVRRHVLLEQEGQTDPIDGRTDR